MKELGTVISAEESPSTNEFLFVVSGKDVRKGQYVQVGRKEEPIIATVSDIFSANRYFERAESVSEYEKNFSKNGGSFSEQFPVSDWEYLVAKCAVQGTYSQGRPAGRVGLPPSPGAKVFEAPHETISEFLMLDPDGLHLGKMLAHELEVKVNLGKMLQKHLAILAMSGAGKSVLATAIIEELLARKKEGGRIGAVVFDLHGEYVSFADKRRNFGWAANTEVVDARKIRIATRRLSFAASELLAGMSSVQSRELKNAVNHLRETNVDEEGHAIPFDLSDVKRHVEANDDIKDNVKGPLLAAIGELGSLRLFAKRDYPRAKDLVKPGKLCVVDISAITNQRKKQMIVASMGGKLFSHRRNGKICPFLMVVEEAHNFAPEQTRKGTSAAASRAAIEKIAREGRKFGACLCLISQRPAHLSSTALAQCNTFCILRVTNPNDIDHIGQSCEAMDSGALGQITTLRVGEGVILGEAVSSPVFVKFRNQKIIKAGKHGALEEIAKKFEEGGKEIADADVEAFI